MIDLTDDDRTAVLELLAIVAAVAAEDGVQPGPDQAVARCCNWCDWITYPLTSDEWNAKGWAPLDDTGDLVATAAGVVHSATHHPREFVDATGWGDVEHALAIYEAFFGGHYRLIHHLALYMHEAR